MALLCCCLRLILSKLKFGTLYSFCVLELRRLKKPTPFLPYWGNSCGLFGSRLLSVRLWTLKRKLIQTGKANPFWPEGLLCQTVLHRWFSMFFTVSPWWKILFNLMNMPDIICKGKNRNLLSQSESENVWRTLMAGTSSRIVAAKEMKANLHGPRKIMEWTNRHNQKQKKGWFYRCLFQF